jgi:hypothetical protein
MSFLVPSADQLSALVAQVLAGVPTLEDHETASLQSAFEAELAKAFAGALTEIEALEKAVDEAIDRVKTEIADPVLAELAAWRAMLSRLNLTAPVDTTAPKPQT